MKMIQTIKELLHASPFHRFTIKTSDGREYLIATPDHAAISPNGARVVIFDDADKQVTLSGLHIVGVEETVTSVN